MTAKRNKVNEYIIREFLKDLKGYKASHNGVEYFQLEDSDFYGGPILRLKNDMGWTILHLTDNEECIIDAAKRIQQTLIELPSILHREKQIDEYCLNNPWTYKGT